jgi:hypothetical protein
VSHHHLPHKSDKAANTDSVTAAITAEIKKAKKNIDAIIEWIRFNTLPTITITNNETHVHERKSLHERGGMLIKE